MWKKFPFVLALLFGLTACYPAGNLTRNGVACHQAGYSYRPYMIDPNGMVC
jgi:hypothetical protein